MDLFSKKHSGDKYILGSKGFFFFSCHYGDKNLDSHLTNNSPSINLFIKKKELLLNII
jgi:hypothetical protein